jgi:flagellar biosynthesis protein FlhF
MNVKRFSARSPREALALVRQAFGDDAVVLSTRPCQDGVEVLAMAPESVEQMDSLAASLPSIRSAAQAAPAPTQKPIGHDSRRSTPAAGAALQPSNKAKPAGTRADAVASIAPPASEIERDVQQLSMSTLSFQDYVRERMLKRRRAELDNAAADLSEAGGAAARAQVPTGATDPTDRGVRAPRQSNRACGPDSPAAARREAPPLPEAIGGNDMSTLNDAAQREREHMLEELRSMKGLIEDRFGALAFMEKLQRNPRQAKLAQTMLAAGFSPALIRKLAAGLPAEAVDELTWGASVLQHNLLTSEREQPIEDTGGVYALVGATGVGKTTSTAKIAAAFAARHGATQLGLVTLDAYRVGAHEQLRAYGRILGVPVHTAHDRASLDDLLDLLSGKKMVLIDTAGMAQRDVRTRELLDMMSHRSIRKLLVLNAAQHGETIEDVMMSYRAQTCHGAVISKLDEAVKLGPVLDALIRHRLRVLGVANGQRVPEDWHRLSANALIQRSLRGTGSASWHLDAGDVSLVFAGVHQGGRADARAA